LSTRIEGCRACGSARLETFLELGDLPLSDGFVASAEEARDAKRYPLDVAFCHDCTLVQILDTVPPAELFGADYPYFSSFTDTLLKHSRENVQARIAEQGLGPNSFVIEIASNDGYLLQFYKEAGVPHLGIDPAPGPVKAALAKGIDTRLAFFGEDYAQSLVEEGIQADVIHANNVLAHVADTNGFVAGIAALLKPNGVAVIEAPYVRDLIDHGEFDTIYHEHLCYFSVTALSSLFARHGIYLNRVERLAIHGGSLRLFVEKKNAPQASVLDLLETERQIGITSSDYYASFAGQVETIRSQLIEILTDLKSQGRSIAGYGAAAKGTILLNFFGIDGETLDFVADRNTHKQGRWVPGVTLPIISPDEIEQRSPDAILILPWNFKDEIMQQQSAHKDRGGTFIIPIPRPVVQ
jgi:SAM-dependent methyltransferase